MADPKKGGRKGPPETNEIPLYNGLENAWNFIRSAFSSAGSTERVGENVPSTAPPR